MSAAAPTPFRDDAHHLNRQGQRMHHLFLLELVVFSGSALVWGAWEYWRTDKLIKKRKAEEAAAAGQPATPSEA